MNRVITHIPAFVLGLVAGIVIVKLATRPPETVPSGRTTDEQALASAPEPDLAPPAEDGPATADPAAAAAAEPAEPEPRPALNPRESAFLELAERIFNGSASQEEQIDFYRQIEESPVLDEAIAALTQRITAEPNSVDSRLDLAKLYIAKLYSGTLGPEQGLWAGRAEEQWKAVLTLDPMNLEAQRSIAFSYSQYPDFLNRTGDAIREYEKAIAIQRELPPSEDHVFSYIELNKLYLKQGNPGRAMTLLLEAREMYPDNQQVAEQIGILQNQYEFEEAPVDP